MASLRQATLRKLRRFSELRGTKAELNSLLPLHGERLPKDPVQLPVRYPFLSAPSWPGQPDFSLLLSASLNVHVRKEL